VEVVEAWGKVAAGQDGRQAPAWRTRWEGQEVQEGEGEEVGEEGTAGVEVRGEQEEQVDGQGRQEWEVASGRSPGGQPDSAGRHCEVEGCRRVAEGQAEQWSGPGPWHCWQEGWQVLHAPPAPSPGLGREP